MDRIRQRGTPSNVHEAAEDDLPTSRPREILKENQSKECCCLTLWNLEGKCFRLQLNAIHPRMAGRASFLCFFGPQHPTYNPRRSWLDFGVGKWSESLLNIIL